MFGFRGASPAYVAIRMVVEYTDAGAALYRTTTADIAARAKMRCGAVKVDHAPPIINDANPSRYLSNSMEHDERLLPGRRDTAEIMMWVWAIGALSLAAVVNQIAIARCRRAQATTEPDLHEQCSPELQSRR
jgi:hypothetical protein